ncbi:MAG: septum formation protein Maf [Actinobacteria bacterium]|nr:septum formation protein Maf [Actinomycetota bacterium]
MSYPPDFQLLLASRSPRRRELLAAAGIPFREVSSCAREEVAAGEPLLTAELNARAKAEGALIPVDVLPPFFVMGVDTIVTFDGKVLGKPLDRDHARAMIAMLSGRRHTVISGVSLCRENARTTRAGGADMVVGCSQTHVWFRRFDDAQIEAYLDTYEWRDKAGAYGIQGRAGLLVEKIEGDYFTVVGLPLGLLVSLFRRLGFDLIARRWAAPATEGVQRPPGADAMGNAAKDRV